MAEAPFHSTKRLRLRAPVPEDAEAIFGGYASDPATTRYLSWPRHRSIGDTHAFLAFSKSAWATWPVGPLLIELKETGELLGSTGMDFETSYRASTGFLLMPKARGFGYASEALAAVATLAESLGVRRLYALCHGSNSSSVRVLERCGFRLEGTLEKYHVFPNLGDPEPQDVLCYARTYLLVGKPGQSRDLTPAPVSLPAAQRPRRA